MEKNKQFKCPCCGSDTYTFEEGSGKCICAYCRADAIIDDSFQCNKEKEIMKYIQIEDFDRARKECEYYLESNPYDSVANWMYFLAKNSIHFVEDPLTKERKPTFYSDIFTRDNVFEDANLKLAIQNASSTNIKPYSEMAQLIEEIRLQTCEGMSQKNHCDIFISFKATTTVVEDGESREIETDDQKFGREIYDYFTANNYSVFFSPVSIGQGNVEGEKYEPKIFSALASAQVMILIGTKASYIKSNWVKDEWSRYLYFMEKAKKSDSSRLKKQDNSLLYVFDSQVPRDLPSEIASIQGINCHDRDYLDRLLAIVKGKIGVGNKAGVSRTILGGKLGKKVKNVNIETLATTEISNNHISKKQTEIAGNISVKKIGENVSIGIINASVEEYLKNAWLSLETSRFQKAEKYFDDALSFGENADALYGKLLVSIKAPRAEQFIENAEKCKDLSYFSRCIDCADKNQVDRIADLFVSSCLKCFNAKHFPEGINYFNAIVAYDMPQRQTIIADTKVIIENMLSSAMQATVINIVIEAYLNAIDSTNIDLYINECLFLVKSLMRGKYLELAETYNKKVLAVDEGNHDALFNKLLIEAKTSSEDVLKNNIENIKIENLELLFASSTVEQANRTIELVIKSIIDYMSMIKNSKKLSDEQMLAPLNVSRTIFKYNFENREQAKVDVLVSVCDYQCYAEKKYKETILNDFVDYLLKMTDSSLVNNHIKLMTIYADCLRKISNFEGAIKYYDRILEIDASDLSVRYSKLLADLKLANDFDLNQIKAFQDGNSSAIKEVEELLKYSLHIEESEDFVETDSNYSFHPLMDNFTGMTQTALKNGIIKPLIADEIYCNFIRYIPTEDKDYMINRLFFMGNYFRSIKEFKLAEKYYHMVLTEDDKNFNAHWACVHSELECRNTIDLIMSKKNFENNQEYDNAMLCANEEQKIHLLMTASKQDVVKDKHYRKILELLVKDVEVNKTIIGELDNCTDLEFKSLIDRKYNEIQENIAKAAREKLENKKLKSEIKRKENERKSYEKDKKNAERKAFASKVIVPIIICLIGIGAIVAMNLTRFNENFTLGFLGFNINLDYENNFIIRMMFCAFNLAYAIIALVFYLKTGYDEDRRHILPIYALTVIESIVMCYASTNIYFMGITFAILTAEISIVGYNINEYEVGKAWLAWLFTFIVIVSSFIIQRFLIQNESKVYIIFLMIVEVVGYILAMKHCQDCCDEYGFATFWSLVPIAAAIVLRLIGKWVSSCFGCSGGGSAGLVVVIVVIVLGVIGSKQD